MQGIYGSCIGEMGSDIRSRLVNNAVGTIDDRSRGRELMQSPALALAQPGSTNQSVMRIQHLDAKCLGKTMYMSHRYQKIQLLEAQPLVRPMLVACGWATRRFRQQHARLCNSNLPQLSHTVAGIGITTCIPAAITADRKSVV